jgi:hypothetical protein
MVTQAGNYSPRILVWTQRSVAMSSISRRRSSRYAAVAVAGFAVLGLLSPVGALGQPEHSAASSTVGIGRSNDGRSSVAPDHRNSPAVLTSRLPWFAPTGHRQPQQADVPNNPELSAWEREQRRLDGELDRRLTICRAC